MREFIKEVVAHQDWTEDQMIDALYDDIKKVQFISGINSRVGTARVTVRVERIENTCICKDHVGSHAVISWQCPIHGKVYN